MSDIEKALLSTLESHPEDWSVRWLVVDKMLERGATDEASALVVEAPAAPSSDAELQRFVDLGGAESIPKMEEFANQNPANAYGHEILATLLEWAGHPEKAAQHSSVAMALRGTSRTQEAPLGAVAAEEAQSGGELPPPPPGWETSSNDGESHSVGLSSPPPPSFINGAVDEIEAASVLDAKPPSKVGSKLTAIFVAVAVHLIIALIALIVVILPSSKDEPEIVAVMAPPSAKKREMQKKNVVKQTKKTSASAAAAAPIAQLMRASAMAKISMPTVTKTSTGPLGMGDADFGSGGFGSGGDGLGSGASFFGGSSTGNRFLFIIDHSGSMKANQVSLRNNEVERALKSLKGVQYQVILFAGGGYYAWPGWSTGPRKGMDVEVKGPKGSYKFVSKRGYADYDFRGADSKLPREAWVDSTPANVKKTMDIIKKHPLFVGTDWELALRIGHLMTPPPDVIFFMSDGSGGNAPAPILAFNRKHGKPVINTVAMQTIQGMKEFAEIAKRTEGSFTIVDKKGKPIDGFDYQKNPGKYKGRL